VAAELKFQSPSSMICKLLDITAGLNRGLDRIWVDLGRLAPPHPARLETPCRCRQEPMQSITKGPPDSCAQVEVVILNRVDICHGSGRRTHYVGQCQACFTVYWGTQ